MTPSDKTQAPADCDGNLSYAVREAHRSFARMLQARVGGHEVSMAQWFFLRVLWEQDGLTQRELSHRVGMMEPTTVAAVNMMEKRGLVRRCRNETDRRKVNIRLTGKGRALRDHLAAAGDEVNAQAVDGIAADEVARAIAVLRRVVANLGPPGAAVADDGGGGFGPLDAVDG